MSIQFARNQAEQLVDNLGMRDAPVDVERIAKKLKLKVMRADLGAEVSALLMTNKDSAEIFVNESHHAHRQRFSIAHEIAHFVLKHQFAPGEHVHVDQGTFISARGPRASKGIDPKEIEANQFAAALLMPSELVRKEARRVLGIDGIMLDLHVSELAKVFKVSDQAMTIRLSTLGLL